MKDLAIELADRPGALAEMGEVLGTAGISVEGGGVFVTEGRGIAHFLFHDADADADAARDVLVRAGITVLRVRAVLVQRLRQDVPGQLGAICEQMAQAGVNIEVMYSDHDNQLILAVDDQAAGERVSAAWAEQIRTADPISAAHGVFRDDGPPSEQLRKQERENEARREQEHLHLR